MATQNPTQKAFPTQHVEIPVGSRFNQWTVIGGSQKRKRTGRGFKYMYPCRCDCGKERLVEGASLLSGASTSCSRFKHKPPWNLKEMVGLRFGRLTVLERRGVDKEGKAQWLSVCDCGKEVVCDGRRLRCGQLKSCGCLRKDVSREWIKELHKRRKMSDGIAHRNVLYNSYKTHAESRSRDFVLSMDDFVRLTKQDCYYCGDHPTPFSIPPKASCNGAYIGNGIDRVNNARGYTLDNCVPCCKNCNRAKMALSQGEFFDLVRRIAHRHNL